MILEDEVDTQPDTDVVVVETDDTTETPVVVEEHPVTDDPAAGIEALKRQIADFEERQRRLQRDNEETRRRLREESDARAELERRYGQAQEDVETIRRREDEARYDSIVNALGAAKAALDHQKDAYQRALVDADMARAADIAAEMAITGGRIQQFEAGKLEYEARAKEQRERPTQTVQTQTQQRQPTEEDRREEFMSRLPPRSADFIRRNYDRYWNDPTFQQKVAQGHHMALGNGAGQDTDEYFRYIEEVTGLRQPVQQQPTVTAPTSKAGETQQRKSPTPAAPTAGTTQSARSPSNSVTLTAEEREMARMLGMEETAYAKHKQDLQKEGLIGTSRVH